MTDNLGRNIWAIAEGYIPSGSTGPKEMLSHETLCILNASEQDAHISLILYFSDREPAGPYTHIIKARRTSHLRFNDLTCLNLYPAILIMPVS